VLKQNERTMTRALQAWGGLAVLWAIAATSWAGLKPLGESYSVLKTLSGHQQNMTMVARGQGGFVAWQNNVGGGLGDRVWIQQLGPGYAGLGSAMIVGPTTQTESEENPQMALLADGGAVVVWEAGPRYAKDVMIRFIEKSGKFATGVAVVNQFNEGPQRAPVVATLANGDVVVAWMSRKQDGNGEGVFAQRFTRLGVKVGQEFMVTQTTERDQISPALVALPKEGFVVGWVTEVVKGVTKDGAPNLKGNVMARFFDSEGRATGNEYQLNSVDALCSQPFLAADPGGGFVAAWTQQDEIVKTNLTDIYVRRFSAAGLPAGVETRHNVNVVGRQAAPKVAFLEDTALVAWETGSRNGSGYEIHARLLSGGAEFRVNTRTAFLQRKPVIIVPENSFVVGWLDVLGAGKSILSGQQYRVGTGSGDVTAGAHVSTTPMPTRTVILTANRSTQGYDAAGEELRSQAEQLLKRYREERTQEVSEAAMVSRQAAAKKAEMKLSSKAAQTLLPPVVRTSPVARQPTAATVKPTRTAKNMVRRSSLPQYRGGQSRTMVSPGRTMLAQNARRAQAASYSQMFIQRQAKRSSAATSVSPQVRKTLAQYQPSRPRANAQPVASPWAAYRPRTSSTTISTRGSRLNLRSTSRITRNVPSQTRASKPNAAQTAANRLRTMRQNAQRRAEQVRNMAPRPVNARLTTRDDKLNLEWDTRLGRSYRVERSTDGRSWQSVGAPRRGTGRMDSISIRKGRLPASYRVVPRN